MSGLESNLAGSAAGGSIPYASTTGSVDGYDGGQAESFLPKPTAPIEEPKTPAADGKTADVKTAGANSSAADHAGAPAATAAVHEESHAASNAVGSLHESDEKTKALLEQYPPAQDLDVEWAQLLELRKLGASGTDYQMRLVHFQSRVQDQFFQKELISKIVGGATESTKNLLQTQV